MLTLRYVLDTCREVRVSQAGYISADTSRVHVTQRRMNNLSFLVQSYKPTLRHVSMKSVRPGGPYRCTGMSETS